MDRLALIVPMLWLVCAAPSGAEIYRYIDANGTLSYTQDLSQVPSKQRTQAREAASLPPSGALQRFSTPTNSAHPASRGNRGPIQVPFERYGTLMGVTAMVNDRAEVPFLIDTGASGVSLPARVADQLGITIRPDTPRSTVRTANGLLSVPVVTLESIQLGGARVERLDATVNPTMDVGLLGGSFFNNYRYSVDAAAGVITLAPNEQVRAGAAADDWRGRFQKLHASIERLETYLEGRVLQRENRRAELEENLARLQRDLVQLELEANRAGVPQLWRR